MIFISDPTIDKREYVKSILGDDCTQEQIIKKIVELEYLEEIEDYKVLRASAYPSYAEQFDQIFHEGVDAWKASIQAVKDLYPKVDVDDEELASRKEQAVFEYQLDQYAKAKDRLAQYILVEGREEITEEIPMPTISEDHVETTIIQSAIDPVSATIIDDTGNEIDNPIVVSDNIERAEAQAIVDATPQEVIDAYNAL